MANKAKAIIALLPLSAALAACGTNRPPAKIIGTYAKNCATAPSNWQKPPADAADRSWAVIRLYVSGRITWNAQPTSNEILRGYLRQFDGPSGELIFVPEPEAKCTEVQNVRRMMSELAMCRRQGQCVEGGKDLPPSVH